MYYVLLKKIVKTFLKEIKTWLEAGFLFVEIEESVVKQLLFFFSMKKRKKIANDMLNILSGGCFSCFICIYDMQ